MLDENQEPLFSLLCYTQMNSLTQADLQTSLSAEAVATDGNGEEL